MSTVSPGSLTRLAAIFAVAFLVPSVDLLRGDTKGPELPSAILVPTAARLVEITATVNFTNESTTDIQKYLFRLTTPPNDLPYQRARLSVPMPETTLKPHKNGLDNYLELKLAIPAKKTVTKEIKFLVLLLPVDFLKAPMLPVADSDREATSKYLQPSPLVESDAPEVRKVAGALFASKASELEKARAAYEYPARVLRYHEQGPAGALKSLQTGSGDCTEYAALFCALCRAGGVPARRVAVFNLASNHGSTSKEPNHETAEVFLPTHGWVPVDPNVGGGKYDRPVGFARASNTEITLKREGAWVWSTTLPPDGIAPNRPKPAVKSAVSWHYKVVQEGNAAKLLSAFAQGE